MPETPDSVSFGDQQRRMAAYLARLAAEERETEQRVRQLAEQERRMVPGLGIEPGAEQLLRLARVRREGIELGQRIAAAQAIAYDEMIAAGGPNNAEAYEKYRETTLRHNALMPQFGIGD